MKFKNKLFALGIILLTIIGIIAMPQAYDLIKQDGSSKVNMPSSPIANASILGKISKIPNQPTEPSLPKAESHNLSVITSLDPAFNSYIDLEYPDLRNIVGFKNLLDKVVLVRNESDLPIHAFVIKWTIQEGNQVPAVMYSPYMKTPTPGHVLTGGVILAPNESRLLSPWFSFSKKQFTNMQANKSGNEAISQFLQSNLGISNKDSKILNSSIDGAIFGDTRFVGSDESKLLDHFECERNGQHDEGVSIARTLKSNASDQTIVDKLNAHIGRGRVLRDKNDRESLYYAARATQAQMFLQIFKNFDRGKLAQVVEKTLRFKPTVLQR